MIRGTTNSIMIDVRGIDLTRAEKVLVSVKRRLKPAYVFDQDHIVMEADDEGTAIIVTLTEAQSLTLKPGHMAVGIEYVMDGVREALPPVTIRTDDTMTKTEVIEDA